MSDVDIIFRGALNTRTEDTKLEVFCNVANKITISIQEEDSTYPSIIILSKETAIKFHRELKKQISFITESEVDNG